MISERPISKWAHSALGLWWPLWGRAVKTQEDGKRRSELALRFYISPPLHLVLCQVFEWLLMCKASAKKNIKGLSITDWTWMLQCSWLFIKKCCISLLKWNTCLATVHVHVKLFARKCYYSHFTRTNKNTSFYTQGQEHLVCTMETGLGEFLTLHWRL